MACSAHPAPRPRPALEPLAAFPQLRPRGDAQILTMFAQQLEHHPGPVALRRRRQVGQTLSQPLPAVPDPPDPPVRGADPVQLGP